MKREKMDMDEILKRFRARPSKEEIEASRAEVLERLRQELGGTMTEFNLAAEQTPASRAVRRLKQVDRLTLRALQILGGKADLNKMPVIVNQLADQPFDLDDIVMSLKRLDRKGKVSMRALFPADAPAQEAATETEPLKSGKLAEDDV